MKLGYLVVALLWCTPTLAQTTFQFRRSQPGVLRWVDFSGPGVISGRYGDPTGLLQAFTSPEPLPTIDTVMKPGDGALGSLHWTLAVGDGGTTGYFANFSDNFLTQFGPGQEFYVQWRQRFDANFLSNPGTAEGGSKQSIIGVGDNPGCTPSQSLDCMGSCTDLEVVTQNTVWRGIPQMYHSCGAKDQTYENLYEWVPSPFDFRLQNMPRSPGCLKSAVDVGDLSGCFPYVANEWLTFQVHIKIGTWYQNQCAFGAVPGCPSNSYNHDSVVQLWVARQGQPSQLVLDFSPQAVPDTCAQSNPYTSIPGCQTGYDLVNLNIPAQKYGKVWLIPRSGNTTFYQLPSNTWYAELIISTNRIADP